MDAILSILNGGDVATLLCLMAILWWLGGKFVEGAPSCRRWGRIAGAAAFLAYGTHRLSTEQPAVAERFLQIAFRGVLAAGLAVGPAWMVLGAAAFLVHVVSQWGELLTKKTKTPPPSQIVYVDRPSPAPAANPPPEPTQEQQYEEALRRYRKNCELIEKSPLDETARNDALAEEKRILGERIKQTME